MGIWLRMMIKQVTAVVGKEIELAEKCQVILSFAFMSIEVVDKTSIEVFGGFFWP
jgi:hypothetical protein